MKKFCILPLVAALAFFVSCQKQQSEEEKKAEVERQVQERLAVERQADEKQRLAQQQAELDAREKALADKEAAAAAAANVPAETPIDAAAEAPAEEPADARQTVRRTRDTSETRSTASYGTFYRKLEPYGDWRETSDYGYVWQPREAAERNWRPYTDGRWVYTDAGWTWVSEEPFGWATYHYGRWVRLRRVGWVWVPGEEWAPAWVSWRTSKDYVGWAPLPPEARFDRKNGIRNWADNYYDIGPDQYAFVPNNEFGSERIQRSVVPIERNITIVIDTTNVTNITFSNTTVVNQGPNFEEMRSRSRRPIERYRLERQLNAETAAAPSVRGEVLVMSAPALVTVPGVDRPQTVKETIAQTSVEKSWSAETDRPAADRARAKMKAESTPPPDAPSKTFVKPEPSGPSGTPATANPPRINASPVTTPSAAIPAAISTPALLSPTPAPTAKATPKPASPIPAPTARAPKPVSSPIAPTTAPVISTPALPSPSVRPRPPAPPLKPSPAPIASPDAIVAPRTTPAVPTTPSTPARAPQTTPRRILPTPLNTPPARPSSTQPAEAVEKPAPRFNPVPRPVASPRITPPASAATESSRPPVEAKPVEARPIVPQTPSGIRLKQPPAPVIATPPPNAAATPASENPKARKRGVKGDGQMEDTQPMPAPISSATPK